MRPRGASATTRSDGERRAPSDVRASNVARKGRGQKREAVPGSEGGEGGRDWQTQAELTLPFAKTRSLRPPSRPFLPPSSFENLRFAPRPSTLALACARPTTRTACALPASSAPAPVASRPHARAEESCAYPVDCRPLFTASAAASTPTGAVDLARAPLPNCNHQRASPCEWRQPRSARASLSRTATSCRSEISASGASPRLCRDPVPRIGDEREDLLG